MATSEGLLVELADAILDDRPIDWAAAESAPDPLTRELVDQLRILAALAALHRSLAFPLESESLMKGIVARAATDRDETPVGTHQLAALNRWGHLYVLELIGRGSFGEVYRAWDPRLDRDVALKLLPAGPKSDDPRALSIIEEGRVLARVRHPNVVTIYGAERIGDRIGLWMELIEGRTLQQMLDEGATFPASETVEIGVQLCRAVSAVHAARLLHRDIKAHNVMRADDGRVVLMDFGTGRDLGSGAGDALAGTPLYLAPELLDGCAPSVVTDIYGVGVLLYHLVTRSYPVHASEIRLLHEAHRRRRRTDVRSVNPEIPVDLAGVIERAVDLNPQRRYPDAASLRADLAALAGRRESRARRWVAGTAALATALAAITYSSARPDEGRLVFSNPVQVTSAGGVETSPTWSPDGEWIAFESDQTGTRDIWVAQPGGAPAVKLIDNAGGGRFPSWSPTGLIAFASVGTFAPSPDQESSRRQAIWVTSGVGDTPRKIHEPEELFAARDAHLSEDGKRLAVSFWTATGMSIEVVSLETMETERLELPTFCEDMSWSPNRLGFACVDAGQPNWAVSRIWLLYPGREPIFLLDDGSKSRDPSWSPDGRRVFFVSNRGGSMDLWQQRLAPDGKPDGKPESLTTGLNLRSFAFSPDGRKLAYSQGRTIGNVWRVPILTDRPATWADAQPITSDAAYIRYIDLTPDGKSLVVDSDRDGRHRLWILPANGGPMTRLTAGPAPDLDPAVSPDGKHIAFYSWSTGNRDLFVMPLEGGPARALATHPAHDINPAWAPDGSEIAFVSARSGSNDIWIVAADGRGEPRRLTDNPALDQTPVWSPDGRSVVFESWREPQAGFWQISASGGAAKPLTPTRGRANAWSPDGGTMYMCHGDVIWARSMESGLERAVATFDGRPGSLGESAMDTDGHYLYFTWVVEQGDIWVVDVSRAR